MAQIYQSAPLLQPTATTRAPAPANLQLPPNPRPISFSAPTKGLLNLGTFSPVNQNGSFEFDRVLKSGRVQRRVKKRGSWKPSWKPSFLVLRPNLLSIYKSEDETGLRGSITLNEITAVADVKKSKVDNVFGVFTQLRTTIFVVCPPQKQSLGFKLYESKQVQSCYLASIFRVHNCHRHFPSFEDTKPPLAKRTTSDLSPRRPIGLDTRMS